jgi:hypothetical protein
MSVPAGGGNFEKTTNPNLIRRRSTTGWTAERRAAYAAMMRERRAWEHSTGPRTRDGKARSSRNGTGRGRIQRVEVELAPIEALMAAMEEARKEIEEACRAL